MLIWTPILLTHTGELRLTEQKLVFDMGWDGEMSLEKYKECLEVADFYTPNTKEALKITGTDTVEKAADILSDYFEYVIN